MNYDKQKPSYVMRSFTTLTWSGWREEQSIYRSQEFSPTKMPLTLCESGLTALVKHQDVIQPLGQLNVKAFLPQDVSNRPSLRELFKVFGWHPTHASNVVSAYGLDSFIDLGPWKWTECISPLRQSLFRQEGKPFSIFERGLKWTWTTLLFNGTLRKRALKPVNSLCWLQLP